MPVSPNHVERVKDVVEEMRQNGRVYVKPRHVLDEVNSIPKNQIGLAPARLEEHGEVECWSDSKSTENTWRLLDG